MFRRLRSLKILAFAAVAVAALSAAEMSQAVAESYLSGEEAELTSLVNQHRAGHGHRQLSTNESLRMVARRQAQRMAMAGYIYHNPNLRQEAQEAIPGYVNVAENVATTSEEGDPDFVHEGLIDSPGHHRNIDGSNYNIIGIGAMAAPDGSKFYTQNFAEWYQNRPPTTGGTGGSAPPPPPQPKTQVLDLRKQAKATASPKPPAPRVTPAPTPPQVTQAPPTPDLATPEPVTPEPVTPAPEVDEPSTESQSSGVGLVQGLGGMFVRFFSRVAFWR